ncbi:MAG: GIY-YIG nuclease family protein [Candidatus Pacebacteria bacterium]|nr:GIY-YIG nuclease family protein [Candidatus Paceibacterota bacterium]
MTQPWFVYIVHCADQTLYIGISDNLGKRIANHNAGKGAKYTRGRTPVKLVYQEKHPGRSTASKREAELKKLTKQEKLKLVASFK